MPVRLRRFGKDGQLLIDELNAVHEPEVNRSLLRLLGRAHRFRAMVLAGNGASTGTLAAQVGVSRSYVTRVLKLSFLSPELVGGFLGGRQPVGVNGRSLTNRANHLPIGWTEHAELMPVD